MDLKETGRDIVIIWDGFSWLKIHLIGSLLAWRWAFRFHKWCAYTYTHTHVKNMKEAII